MDAILPRIVGVAGLILAQAENDPDRVADVANKGSDPVQLIISLAFYLFFAFCLYTICNKLNVENGWFAWIPVLNVYVSFKAGDEPSPVLWTILMLIPLVNFVAIFIYIKAWINITKKLGKSPWILLLTIIPVINLAVMGYLAFG
jgi:hypothetical protein